MAVGQRGDHFRNDSCQLFNMLFRFRILLNDGEYSNSFVMLATKVKLGAFFPLMPSFPRPFPVEPSGA